jgi:hypothetical protein
MKTSIRSFLGLSLGLVLGQGSFFALQTWLLSNKEFGLVSSLGLAITVVTFIQWFSDFGGTALLNAAKSYGEPPEYYCSVVLLRFFLSLPVFACSVAVAVLYVRDDLERMVIIWGGVSAIFWSFNLSGLIDAAKLNHITGPLNALPWILVSFVVLVSITYGFRDFGAYVGAGFSLGVLVNVVVQYWIYPQGRAYLNVGRGSRVMMLRYLKVAVPYMVANSPAQIYPRYQIGLVGYYLSNTVTASFLYGKSMQNACSQVVAVMRRAEFSGLCLRASRDAPISIKDVFLAQKTTNILAVFLTLLMVGWAFVGREVGVLEQGLLPILFVVLLFPFWAVASSFGQILLAYRYSSTYAVGLILFLPLPVLLLPYVLPSMKIAGLFVVEALMYLLQIAFYAFAIVSRKRQ